MSAEIIRNFIKKIILIHDGVKKVSKTSKKIKTIAQEISPVFFNGNQFLKIRYISIHRMFWIG